MRRFTHPVVCVIALVGIVLAGCNSSTSESAQESTDNSSVTTPPISFDAAYPVHDWRYVDYIFFFVQEERNEEAMNSLTRKVRQELGDQADACVSSKAVDAFDLADVARKLSYTLGTYLDETQLSRLTTDLANDIALDTSGDFGAFVFPNEPSAVRNLLDWWISKCGDGIRGSFTSTTTTTPPASTVPYSQRPCSELWKVVGRSDLPAKCKPVKSSNCRVRSQELIWDSFSSSFKTLSTYQEDLAFADGTSARSYGQTYMIPC